MNYAFNYNKSTQQLDEEDINKTHELYNATQKNIKLETQLSKSNDMCDEIRTIYDELRTMYDEQEVSLSESKLTIKELRTRISEISKIVTGKRPRNEIVIEKKHSNKKAKISISSNDVEKMSGSMKKTLNLQARNLVIDSKGKWPGACDEMNNPFIRNRVTSILRIYKKSMCRYRENQGCTQGNRCLYAHHRSELV
jgi:hypothetical protein